MNRLLSEHAEDYVYLSASKAKKRNLEIVASLVQNGAFTFSCVRNPWDRLISAWLNKIKNTRGSERFLKSRLRRCQQLDSSALVDEIVNGDFAFFVEKLAGSELFSKDNHFKPQSKILAHHRLDYLARFERYERDMLHILHRLGLPRLELPHLNSTRGQKRSKAYYSPRTQDIVRELYARDIEKYKYTFEEI